MKKLFKVEYWYGGSKVSEDFIISENRISAITQAQPKHSDGSEMNFSEIKIQKVTDTNKITNYPM